MWPPIDLQAWPGAIRSSLSLPVLGRYAPPTMPTVGSLCKNRDERVRFCETIWTEYVSEAFKASTETKILGCGHRGLLESSMGTKFPCLLKLPRSNVEWPASFLQLSLPSLYWNQSQFIPRKLLSLRINVYIYIYSYTFHILLQKQH